ncbi:SET domain-containing protein [Eremomyces bilateralis CBS 781.70]|uniref:SET domain-containing protein n=1 Tax=Eremomyces bilateralis CBS 781.70 TaxID=1392243 RepID=A0A6G1FQF7_9PEZI|nr:SET domain-containing protein [Eremomyces bilateralis CBS 781.70]KAF1808065.1 SET domain-containing protein [Eremomyces bilateralis CBS 781.70]
MAKNIIVQPSPLGGRGVFASKSFSPGEELFTVSRPLLSSLDGIRLHDTCVNCLKWDGDATIGVQETPLESTLKACSGCKIFKYCRKECQREHWRLIHKVQCPFISKQKRYQDYPASVRGTMDLLLMIPNLQLPQKQAIGELLSHIEERSKGGEWETTQVLAVAACKFAKRPDNDAAFALSLYCKVMTNAITLVGKTLDPLGLCVDLFVSCINHSCDPNVFFVMDGQALSARCLKKIQEGDELSISYVEPTNPTMIRRKELKEKFFFDCKCPKCLNEGNTPEDRFQGDSSTDGPAKRVQDEAFNTLFSVRRGKVLPEKIISELKRALDLCQRSGFFSIERQPIPSICSDLYVELMMQDRHDESFEHVFKIYTETDPKWYPNFHPARLAHTYVLARLMKYFCFQPGREPQELRGHDLHLVYYGLLLEIESNLNKSHGPTHSFAKGVRAEINMLREELQRDAIVSIHRELPSIMTAFRGLKKQITR